MKNSTRLGLLLAALLAPGLRPLFGANPVATLPATAHRVIFLGDSITHGGAYVCDIAAYFATRHPPGAREFIALGLSSETVSGLSEAGHAGGKFPRPDLHERLTRVLTQARPDLVFACYGMNDGIYLPLAEERFQKFKDGTSRLHEQVVRGGARIIHLTPPVYDEAKGGKAGYAAVLDRYSAWLLDQRRVAGWEVIDVHAPMQQALDEGRRQDPTFSFAKDGVHPNELGHWIMARAILAGLGAQDVAGVPTAQAMVAVKPKGAEILRLVTQQQNVLKSAWLTATGHKRPGVKPGLPLAEAQAQATKLQERISALALGAP